VARDPSGPEAVLLIQCGERSCAVPARHVVETMRPLPIEEVAGAPAFVLGVSRIRGAAVPVVDLAAVLGAKSAPDAGRFVTLSTGERRVAIAVDGVLGVHRIDGAAFGDLPPLLAGAAAEVVAAIAASDRGLLYVLEVSRLLAQAAPSASAEATP
jgi:purine-binding chemotaxis protein CheW